MSITKNLKVLNEKILSISKLRSDSLKHFTALKFIPRLIAVSKLKSTQDIIEAYNAGQRHFGENYVKELEKKSNSENIIASCPEIKWHFIAGVKNLHMVETVDSIQQAEKLNKAWFKNRISRNKIQTDNNLKIKIQVNTSQEKQKNGAELNSVVEICKHVINECKFLELTGLMTIGSLNESLNQSNNRDFQILIQCKETVVKKLEIDKNMLELSMGMSNDYETAILMGSSWIRVGSLIFGERN